MKLGGPWTWGVAGLWQNLIKTRKIRKIFYNWILCYQYKYLGTKYSEQYLGEVEYSHHYYYSDGLLAVNGIPGVEGLPDSFERFRPYI